MTTNAAGQRCPVAQLWLPGSVLRHADTAPSLKPLVMAGVRGMPHVLTESAAMPPHRVCGDGFECVRRAGTSTIGRPDGTLDAASAHSAPSAHTRRRQRTLGTASRRPNRTGTRFPSPHTGAQPHDRLERQAKVRNECVVGRRANETPQTRGESTSSVRPSRWRADDRPHLVASCKSECVSKKPNSSNAAPDQHVGISGVPMLTRWAWKCMMILRRSQFNNGQISWCRAAWQCCIRRTRASDRSADSRETL